MTPDPNTTLILNSASRDDPNRMLKIGGLVLIGCVVLCGCAGTLLFVALLLAQTFGGMSQ
jgi:hypothetical protein